MNHQPIGNRRRSDPNAIRLNIPFCKRDSRSTIRLSPLALKPNTYTPGITFTCFYRYCISTSSIHFHVSILGFSALQVVVKFYEG